MSVKEQRRERAGSRRQYGVRQLFSLWLHRRQREEALSIEKGRKTKKKREGEKGEELISWATDILGSTLGQQVGNLDKNLGWF